MKIQAILSYKDNEKKIGINFISQGLTTLDHNGKENPISKLIGWTDGTCPNTGKTDLGRKTGSNETTLEFLSKEKNKKALDYLKKGYKVVEVSINI